MYGNFLLDFYQDSVTVGAAGCGVSAVASGHLWGGARRASISLCLADNSYQYLLSY